MIEAELGISYPTVNKRFDELLIALNLKEETTIIEKESIDMSVFVYDYDHNAPTTEHLEKTHEPFFKRIREAHPDLSILMMTRPKACYNEENSARREVVRRTYENAVAAGDTLVRFLDGETFYGDVDRELCSIDGVHPNDLGFYRMATAIRPVLEELLLISTNKNR